MHTYLSVLIDQIRIEALLALLYCFFLFFLFFVGKTIMNGDIIYNKAHNNAKYNNKKQKRIKLKTICNKMTVKKKLR